MPLLVEVMDQENLQTTPLTKLEGIAALVKPLSLPPLTSEPIALRLSTKVRKHIEYNSARSVVQRFFKRFLDVVLSGTALIVLSPFLASFALLIKKDSEGPILFSQTRVGKGGRLFRLYKFRTMVQNAEDLKQSLIKYNETDGPAFKMKHDPRVTKLGRFLRRSSLDELPQLWNVLVGDMSLVGPRPALPAEVLEWEPWQFNRLSVEQGCTCIWQVSGRSETSFQEWMEMDLEYVSKWSILLDLTLIVRTILVMINGRGAY